MINRQRTGRSGRGRPRDWGGRIIGAWLTAVCLVAILESSASAELTTLRVVDYAEAPITGQLSGGNNNAASLARINFMAEEPGGGDRFFVNDSDGPLYILDKNTKSFTEYLNFNGNSSEGGTGLFDKLPTSYGFASGLVTFQFDPDYANNGKFYTVHTEDPSASGSTIPDNTDFPGLDTTGYTTTTAYTSPGTSVFPRRESVLIEWTDTDTSNNTFEGSARELLRLNQNGHIHPMGDLIFNPTAGPGDDDWRVMYVSVGDGGSGELSGSTRLNPQRLDQMVGKVLRIVPDLGEHTSTSTVSDNGRYRVPDDNPFVSISGARPEVYANGLRNPHRMSWDVDPLDSDNNQLIVNDIGLYHWEEVDLIHPGANYGYSLREGNQLLNSGNGTEALPMPDTIPWQIDDTTTNGTVTPTYPVIQYGHGLSGQSQEFAGDAISSGFVYRGSKIPALYGKYIFGDITTGSLFYADYQDMLDADDGNPSTMADVHTLDLLWDDPNDAPDDGEELYTTITSTDPLVIESPLFQIVEAGYAARGGLNSKLAGSANITGNLGRADIRLQVDEDGELYVLSKADGVIRAILGPNPIPGDYNNDGFVTEDDFLEWRGTFGMTVAEPGLGADGNGNGVIDAGDYTVWRDNLPIEGAGSAAAVVPEPAGTVLLMIGALLLAARKRR